MGILRDTFKFFVGSLFRTLEHHSLKPIKNYSFSCLISSYRVVLIVQFLCYSGSIFREYSIIFCTYSPLSIEKRKHKKERVKKLM